MGWFAFGFIEGWKRLELKHITFTSPDLPPYFDGYRLVQITDFHLGSFPPSNDFVQKVVDATNNEEPDMILFTGDLVNNQASEVEPYLDTAGAASCVRWHLFLSGEIMIIVNMATIILLAL